MTSLICYRDMPIKMEFTNAKAWYVCMQIDQCFRIYAFKGYTYVIGLPSLLTFEAIDGLYDTIIEIVE